MELKLIVCLSELMESAPNKANFKGLTWSYSTMILLVYCAVLSKTLYKEQACIV